MAVYEVGILINGIPAVSKTYYSEAFTELDEKLRTGLITAIQGFAIEAFSDEIDTVQMKHFIIASVARKKENCIFTAFAIFDKKTNVQIIRKNLLTILNQFLEKYPITSELNLEKESFNEFLPSIDQVMQGIALKPEDKIKRIFG
ncbi:MAG: hypothetical protein ACFFC7_18260 [Candidatus Hermodarchaeota archaeon]